MRLLPRQSEGRLREALGAAYNPDCSYRGVHTREQKAAYRRGWKSTGKTLDMGKPHGEVTVYLVPGEAPPVKVSGEASIGTPAAPKKKTLFKKKLLKKKAPQKAKETLSGDSSDGNS